MDLQTVQYIIYAILGLGIIIFIHELGHFLAAKKAGVRVEAFSIGFDPPLFGRKLRLFSFRRGETEYIVGLVPLGGYVKMAGETQMDVEDTGRAPEPDWLVAKPASSRAMVFAAGAIFNILSAGLFFAVAFSMGVTFISTRVGETEPGKPAWRAGIRAGDVIRSIDGEPVTEFSEIMVSTAFAGQEPLRFEVERDGELLPPIEVQPEWNEEREFLSIGVRPALDPVVADVTPGSPAERAGIRAGDLLLGVRLDGTELTAVKSVRVLNAVFERYTTERPGEPFDVLVESGGTQAWKTLLPRRAEDQARRTLLGVEPIYPTLIEELRPDSAVRDLLRPGDRIISVDGRDVRGFSLLSFLGGAADGGQKDTIRLGVESDEAAVREVVTDRSRLLGWFVGRDIYSSQLEAVLGTIEESSPLHASGLRSGDTIVHLGGSWVHTPAEFSELAAAAPGDELAVGVLRDGRRLPEPISISRSVVLGLDDGVPWNRNPRVRPINDSVPAGRLGIEAGSRIVSIGGSQVTDWSTLEDAVQKHEEGTVEVRWSDPSATERSGTTRLEVDPYERLGLVYRNDEHVVQSSLLGSAALGLHRTVHVAKLVFLTLRGLLKGDVGAKNLSGPVGIVHLIVRVSEIGLGTLIYYLALISVNLGILNLLPIPILDGGHLLFLLIEKIKGSPVSLRVQEIATTVALFLFLGLAVFVTYNDILRIFAF